MLTSFGARTITRRTCWSTSGRTTPRATSPRWGAPAGAQLDGGGLRRDYADQLRRPDNHPADLLVTQRAYDPRRDEREFAKVVFADLGRDLELVANLAVNLHHAGDLVLSQQIRVRGRPGCPGD